MIQATAYTWLLTRIGVKTMVRVDVDGPIGTEEIQHLIKNLELAATFSEKVVPEAAVKEGSPSEGPAK